MSDLVALCFHCFGELRYIRKPKEGYWHCPYGHGRQDTYIGPKEIDRELDKRLAQSIRRATCRL